MAKVDEPNRLPLESQPLLRAVDSGPSSQLDDDVTWPPVPVEHQHSLCGYYHVVTAAVPPITDIRVLLVFLPLGLAAGVFNWSSMLSTIFNFLAIIPLSAAVSNYSDTLSEKFGDLLGALVNATFGNAVELIIGILAVIHKDPHFAQSVVLGSILSDILFVLGVCIVSGAWRKPILKLNAAVADALSSLMIIAAVALILPTTLYSTFESSKPLDLEKQVAAFSRGTAVVLFILYCAYLYFELGSHKYLFDTQTEGNDIYDNGDYNNITPQHEPEQGTQQDTEQDEVLDAEQDHVPDAEQETEQETPTHSNLLPTITYLLCSAGGIMICSHFLLNSINETSKVTHISRTFIATVLIPIASNAPECATVMRTSKNGRIDYAVGVIVGSILQIALFVIPFLVGLGWAIHQPMTLYFDTFHAVILFCSVLLVNHVLKDANYTYMHGFVLVGLYGTIALAFYLRHET